MSIYTSESSDSGDLTSMKTLDYSYKKITNQSFEEEVVELKESVSLSREKKPEVVQKFLLGYNSLSSVPCSISKFYNLRHLDLSNNSLKSIPEFITKFPLHTFVAHNNYISCESLPKSFLTWSLTLRVFNLGGNNLRYFPPQLLDVPNLKQLYLGGNSITEIPSTISKITGLAVLCLGGNQLTDLPDSLGMLHDLEVLIVSDNCLQSIPPTIAHLNRLKTLQLHKNQLRTLPTEIIALKCLTELSLRENPLVVKFVNDMTLNPASLLEMSARVVKVNSIPYTPLDLPASLINYLASAHHCINPKCNGVYFNSRVEHVKFVDFCGKYRIPLMQYLCSSKCAPETDGCAPGPSQPNMLRKVLLG